MAARATSTPSMIHAQCSGGRAADPSAAEAATLVGHARPPARPRARVTRTHPGAGFEAEPRPLRHQLRDRAEQCRGLDPRALFAAIARPERGPRRPIRRERFEDREALIAHQGAPPPGRGGPAGDVGPAAFDAGARSTAFGGARRRRETGRPSLGSSPPRTTETGAGGAPRPDSGEAPWRPARRSRPPSTRTSSHRPLRGSAARGTGPPSRGGADDRRAGGEGPRRHGRRRHARGRTRVAPWPSAPEDPGVRRSA